MKGALLKASRRYEDVFNKKKQKTKKKDRKKNNLCIPPSSTKNSFQVNIMYAYANINAGAVFTRVYQRNISYITSSLLGDRAIYAAIISNLTEIFSFCRKVPKDWEKVHAEIYLTYYLIVYLSNLIKLRFRCKTFRYYDRDLKQLKV